MRYAPVADARPHWRSLRPDTNGLVPDPTSKSSDLPACRVEERSVFVDVELSDSPKYMVPWHPKGPGPQHLNAVQSGRWIPNGPGPLMPTTMWQPLTTARQDVLRGLICGGMSAFGAVGDGAYNEIDYMTPLASVDLPGSGRARAG